MSNMMEMIHGETFSACAEDNIGLVRKAQEDSHGMDKDTPNGAVFVVCDGMGGHVGGSKASSLAVKSILWYLKKEKYDDIEEALKAALRYANDQILGYAQDHPGYKGMGTTACIVLLRAGVAHIVHVGDSRIYLYLGKEQTLHRVTKDHSYVQTLVDAGEITDEEAEHHPNKNQILQALGAKRPLRPGYQVIYPKTEDVFLICSDGMSGMMTDVCIEAILSEPIPLADKVDKLIRKALEGGGNDNVTVELIRIDKSSNIETKFRDYNPPKQESKWQQPCDTDVDVISSASYSHGQTKPNGASSSPRHRNSDYERYMSFVKRYWKWILGVLLVIVLIWAGGAIGLSNSKQTNKEDLGKSRQNELDLRKKSKDVQLRLETLNNGDEQLRTATENTPLQSSSQQQRRMNENQGSYNSDIKRAGEVIDSFETDSVHLDSDIKSVVEVIKRLEADSVHLDTIGAWSFLFEKASKLFKKD